MHAYLVVGKNPVAVDEKAGELANSHSIDSMEIPLKKIEDMKELEKFVKLQLSKKTSILIKNIHEASPETLNAFLKNLEEPQDNLTYILTSANEGLLPKTIVSRCQVISVVSTNTNNGEIAGNFMNSSVTERLAGIDTIKNRPDAINYLNELVLGLHILLIKGGKSLTTISQVIKFAQKAIHAIEANGNVGLQMTNFIVQTNTF